MHAAALAFALTFAVASDRPDTPNSDELFRFDEGDVVEAHDSVDLLGGAGRFRVHYTRAGDHAVPLADDDASGVPDHVEEIAAVYEEVAAFYAEALGYRAPLADDDARFDVYLVDFGFSADGAFRAETCFGPPGGGDVAATCAGFMVQENDFAGYGYPSVTYANRLLASHEYFHAVQSAYDASQGAVLGEGTAVWASEQFDPGLDDMEIFGSAYLEETDRPLNADGSGPVDSFTYGAAIFFEHVAQAHGDDVVRALWERVAAERAAGNDADWFGVLDAVLVDAGSEGFAADLTSFATSTIGDVTPQNLELPVRTPSFLVFISSWHTLSFAPAGRDEVRVALAGSGDDVEGTVLVVAPDGVTPEVVAPVADPTPAVEGGEPVFYDATFPAQDAFFRAQIINTRQAGNGARPRLCIGASDEVDACLAEGAVVAPAPDAGPGDDVAPPGGCACDARANRAAPDAALAGALAALACARRWRRRGYVGN